MEKGWRTDTGASTAAGEYPCQGRSRQTGGPASHRLAEAGAGGEITFSLLYFLSWSTEQLKKLLIKSLKSVHKHLSYCCFNDFLCVQENVVRKNIQFAITLVFMDRSLKFLGLNGLAYVHVFQKRCF